MIFQQEQIFLFFHISGRGMHQKITSHSTAKAHSVSIYKKLFKISHDRFHVV